MYWLIDWFMYSLNDWLIEWWVNGVCNEIYGSTIGVWNYTSVDPSLNDWLIEWWVNGVCNIPYFIPLWSNRKFWNPNYNQSITQVKSNPLNLHSRPNEIYGSTIGVWIYTSVDPKYDVLSLSTAPETRRAPTSPRGAPTSRKEAPPSPRGAPTSRRAREELRRAVMG